MTADPLTCVATKTCVYSNANVGCCDSGPISLCTNIFTACAGYYDTCTGACLSNFRVLKCLSAKPYCATFSFATGTYNYNCQATKAVVTEVAWAQSVLTSISLAAHGSTQGGGGAAVTATTVVTTTASGPGQNSKPSLNIKTCNFEISLTRGKTANP